MRQLESTATQVQSPATLPIHEVGSQYTPNQELVERLKKEGVHIAPGILTLAAQQPELNFEQSLPGRSDLVIDKNARLHLNETYQKDLSMYN